MRNVTLNMLVVGLIAAAIAILVCPHRGPHSGRAKEERVSWVVSPAPPETIETQQRWRIKRDLTRRIINERIPLLEAAELFREANGEDGMHNLPLSNPNRSVRELLCRQVIDYVATVEREWECEGRGRSGTRVSEELQHELDQRIAAGEFPPASGR